MNGMDAPMCQQDALLYGLRHRCSRCGQYPQLGQAFWVKCNADDGAMSVNHHAPCPIGAAP